MSDPVEALLYDAAQDGRVSEVSSLLRDHPDINVNWTDYNHRTALHAAGWNGHVEVVKLLLAHPDIDVNVRNRYGQTPFSIGCWYDQGSIIVRLLLKDPRVDVKLDDNEGCTLLRYASCSGRHEVIEWLIASGRDLGDVENKKGEHWDGKYYTALEIAREYEKTEAVSLLERFLANPAQTRHEVRVKLGVLDELAAEVFALTVFLCDDLLQLKPASHLAATPDHAAATAIRFFAIAKRLPMELQMILCHHAVGSMKQNILRKDSEIAFKALARILLQSD